MSTPATNDYDRVAYPSMAHPQTHADNLAVKGFLRGLNVAPPDRCRVLELGCGDGFNLAAMAISHPASTYVGIDYSAEAVERGRGFMRDLGLDQVRLEAADIRDLGKDRNELGTFDYIVAHGVYSWVPADVRNALFASVERLLAPQGVAFVSHLALPGAYMRELVRTIIRFHTRTIKDPKEQVRQSRAILRVIGNGTTQPNHYTQLIADELKLIEVHADEGLYHDELSAVSAPLLFTEFIAHAAEHGLQFLAEAEYLYPISPTLTPETREQLRPLEANRVLLEQYLDFVEGRRFRQTLLCRPGLGRVMDLSRLDSLWISCRATPETAVGKLSDAAPVAFRGHKNARVIAHKPYEKAALTALSRLGGESVRFPDLLRTVREMLQAEGLDAGAEMESDLRQYLCRANLPGLAEIFWNPPAHSLEVPARPFGHPLARWLLKRDAPSVVSYTGRFVEVNGSLGRHLLSLLDGTRTVEDLVGEIRRFLAEQHAAAKARGETAKLPPPDDPAVPEQLNLSLRGLAGLGLLKRE